MPIAVDIHTDQIQLTDQLHDYVQNRVEKLDRYLDVLEEAAVDLKFVGSARNAEDRNVAQLTVRGKSVVLRAEERTSDIYASVDAVLAKVHRQIERYKGKHWRARGDGRTMSEALAAESELEVEVGEETDVIARRKLFHLTPMSELEAIEQMALLGHDDFFIFFNAETDSVNVLYRRRDGTLGLIESEIV